MSYPLLQSSLLSPQQSFDVTFRPSFPGVIKLIATASASTQPTPSGPPPPRSSPEPVHTEPPNPPPQLGVRVQLFKPGAASPVVDAQVSQAFPTAGLHHVLVWRDFTAVAADLTGDWRARITCESSVASNCAVTARYPTVAGDLGKIDHVVVLMLENRSFDHVLGYLRRSGGRSDVDGLTGEETNPDTDGSTVTVYPATTSAFKDDPHHGLQDVDIQLAGGNQGFVKDFATASRNEPHKAVMSYLTPAQVPTYDRLAAAFTICDRWFASLPTDTWPNRLYAMTGGSGGSVTTPSDASVLTNPPGYSLRTIFEVLEAQAIDWGVFFSDVSFTLIFKALVQDARYTSRIRAMDSFYERASTGSLPSFTWLEPNYNDLQGDHFPTDDHPPTDAMNAQALVAQIYNALVQSPAWSKTMFVVTYDEHGGFFDHVRPPGTDLTTSPIPLRAVASSGTGGGAQRPLPPDAPPDDDRSLRRYGVRVPAFVISPWVAARSCSHTTYDHTSVLKTALLRFCADASGKIPSMGARTDGANDLGELLVEPAPRGDIPASLPVPALVSVPFDYGAPTTERPPAGFATVLRQFILGF